MMFPYFFLLIFNLIYLPLESLSLLYHIPDDGQCNCPCISNTSQLLTSMRFLDAPVLNNLWSFFTARSLIKSDVKILM